MVLEFSAQISTTNISLVQQIYCMLILANSLTQPRTNKSVSYVLQTNKQLTHLDIIPYYILQNKQYQYSKISHNKQMQMQPTKMQIQQTTSYKDKIRIRFRQQINQIVNKHSLPELVIVLDTVSAFLLSNVFSINDLVAMKILYIQKLDRKRKKLDKHALYFITPTKNNIDCLIRDFPVLQQNQVPQYRRIHILFTTFIDPPTLRQLAIHKGLLKRIAKNSIKQFYFSARILAGNLVDMNIPYLGCAYSKQSQEQEIRRQLICRKIVQFIANHNSINTVRVFYKKSANKVCQRLANSLEIIIKNYLGILLQNRSPYLSKSAPDLTILLLDRSIDTVTPFIHSFTYQALLFDFFSISMVTKSDLEDKGAYSYEQIQNSVYDEFRYQHVSEALSKIPQSLQNQKGKLQSLKTIGNDKIDIRQLTQRIGEYKANIQRLQAIWKQFQNQKMQDIADLQQSIATGITSNSENTSSTKLIQDVITLCKNPNITREQKLRLGILVISCIKTSKEDYEMLLEQFGNDDKKILKNMLALGASYDGTITKSTKTVTKDQQKIAEKRMQTTGMHLNRYTSIVELVIPLFCKILSDPVHSQTIDKQVFGQVVCSIFKTGEEQINFKQNRFALAMIGGMSWSEVSAIRMMQQLNDIVIMADSVMNANQFLKEIAKINIIGY